HVPKGLELVCLAEAALGVLAGGALVREAGAQPVQLRVAGGEGLAGGLGHDRPAGEGAGARVPLDPAGELLGLEGAADDALTPAAVVARRHAAARLAGGAAVGALGLGGGGKIDEQLDRVAEGADLHAGAGPGRVVPAGAGE